MAGTREAVALPNTVPGLSGRSAHQTSSSDRLAVATENKPV